MISLFRELFLVLVLEPFIWCFWDGFVVLIVRFRMFLLVASMYLFILYKEIIATYLPLLWNWVWTRFMASEMLFYERGLGGRKRWVTGNGGFVFFVGGLLGWYLLRCLGWLLRLLAVGCGFAQFYAHGEILEMRVNFDGVSNDAWLSYAVHLFSFIARCNVYVVFLEETC